MENERALNHLRQVAATCDRLIGEVATLKGARFELCLGASVRQISRKKWQTGIETLFDSGVSIATVNKLMETLAEENRLTFIEKF